MKIGIFTFHRATNYGAILQAYALVSYLKNLGHEVKVVDYKPKGVGQLYASLEVPGVVNKVKRILLNIQMLCSLKKRIQRRNMFWNYTAIVLPLTASIRDEESLPVFDAILVGSDQVWSTCFTGGLDKFYYGQFNTKGARLVSYAGSAAEDMEDSFYSTENAKMLNVFDFISVREEELQKYLQSQLQNKNIVKVLDPTLMAGESIFDELISGVRILNKPYVLIYQVIRKQDFLIQEYAKKVASEQGLDIAEVIKSELYVNGVAQKGLVDPTMFLSLIKYAQYVITTSFHGTAFSLMFNRPFCVVSISPEVDSRAEDLLAQLDLKDLLVQLPCDTRKTLIDWQAVKQKLDSLRIPSRDFIIQSLK